MQSFNFRSVILPEIQYHLMKISVNHPPTQSAIQPISSLWHYRATAVLRKNQCFPVTQSIRFSLMANFSWILHKMWCKAAHMHQKQLLIGTFPCYLLLQCNKLDTAAMLTVYNIARTCINWYLNQYSTGYCSNSAIILIKLHCSKMLYPVKKFTLVIKLSM